MLYQVAYLSDADGWRCRGGPVPDRDRAEHAYASLIHDGTGLRVGLFEADGYGAYNRAIEGLLRGDTLAPDWLYVEYRDKEERFAWLIEHIVPEGETRPLAVDTPYVTPSYPEMVKWAILAARYQRGELTS